MEYRFTKDNFNDEVINSKIPVMVDFYAKWCGPCQMMMPIVEEMAEKYDGRVKVGKVNTDEQPELAVQFDISSIPTLLLFKNGECVSTQVGYHSKRDLITLINHFK